MKTLALLTLALVFAGAANAEASFSDEAANRPDANTAESKLTRAEVQADYLRAVAAGEIVNGESSPFAVNQQAGSARDVGSVRAEAVETARSHMQDMA